jgi:hypothetical protein
MLAEGRGQRSFSSVGHMFRDDRPPVEAAHTKNRFQIVSTSTELSRAISEANSGMNTNSPSTGHIVNENLASKEGGAQWLRRESRDSRGPIVADS